MRFDTGTALEVGGPEDRAYEAPWRSVQHRAAEQQRSWSASTSSRRRPRAGSSCRPARSRNQSGRAPSAWCSRSARPPSTMSRRPAPISTARTSTSAIGLYSGPAMLARPDQWRGLPHGRGHAARHGGRQPRRDHTPTIVIRFGRAFGRTERERPFVSFETNIRDLTQHTPSTKRL